MEVIMHTLGKYFTIIIAILFVPLYTAYSQDASIPDTVRIEDAIGDIDGEYSAPFAVPVSVYNDNDLTSMIIPLFVDGYSGWIRFDSVSYIGSRLSDSMTLESREVSSFGTDLRTVDSLILKFEIGTGDALPAGDGKICELWFRPNYGGDVSIDSLPVSPYGNLTFATTSESFTPQFLSGTVQIECDYMVGDTRNDGAINVSDLLGIYKGYLGCFGFDFTDPWHADVNCDRYTDLRDAFELVSYIFGNVPLCECGSYSEPLYDDPGIPDTVWIESDTLYVGKQDTIDVGIINDESLRGFAFALEWDGNAVLQYSKEIFAVGRADDPNVMLQYYQCDAADMNNPDTMFASTWQFLNVTISPGSDSVLKFIVIPRATGSLSFRFVDFYANTNSLAIGAESMLVTEANAAILPILAGGDIVVMPAYICGDANDDDFVNITDAVWIINYVFQGGSPPIPFDAGDTNCDGDVNVSDAIYIINYIFVGGNIPCDIDGDSSPDC
jgi:hypothetical protein